MYRRLITQLLIIFIAPWSLLSVPLSVYAHGDEAYSELNDTRAQPGTSITIRSSGSEPGDATTIMLMLVSRDRPQAPGTATADDHGDPDQDVSLPANLIGGAYEVRAADIHRVVTALSDVVNESCDDGESDQRGEDEPLLAPIPTQVASVGYFGTAPTACTTAPSLTPQVEPPIPIS